MCKHLILILFLTYLNKYTEGGILIIPISMLALQGVTEYEPRVVEQLLNFMYRHVADILQDAEVSVGSEIREHRDELDRKPMTMPDD